MFFQAEAYVLMDYLAINCMVTSGFVCWLRNRYLFCLKQAYNDGYSCNTIDPSVHCKTKILCSNGFCSKLSKACSWSPQQKPVQKENNMLWCTLKGKIWEALTEAARTHLSHWKANKPLALCTTIWCWGSKTSPKIHVDHSVGGRGEKVHWVDCKIV